MTLNNNNGSIITGEFRRGGVGVFYWKIPGMIERSLPPFGFDSPLYSAVTNADESLCGPPF
jgi:hypothetical protein